MATFDPDKPKPRFEALNPPTVQPVPLQSGGPGALAPPRSTAQNSLAETAAAMKATSAPESASMQTAARPLQNAIAITYNTRDGAPRVVAKGRGAVAEQIIARAREHGVFVHQSKELVALLMQVELDDHIPPALYRAVAELLAWLYTIESARLGGKV